jgi:hypothetical protein
MLERCVCRLAQLLEGAGPSALLVLRSTIQLSDPAVVEDEGIEPSTLGLQSQCSPAELIPPNLVGRRIALRAGESSRTAETHAVACRSLKTK